MFLALFSPIISSMYHFQSGFQNDVSRVSVRLVLGRVSGGDWVGCLGAVPQ